MNTVKIEICDNIGEIEQKLENFNVNNLLVLKKNDLLFDFLQQFEIEFKIVDFCKNVNKKIISDEKNPIIYIGQKEDEKIICKYFSLKASRLFINYLDLSKFWKDFKN